MMNLRRSGSATGGLRSPWPSTITALRRLAPITAPRPPRPSCRPRLLTMPANSTPRSPAGPMTAASPRGYSSPRRASDDGTSRPHSSPAGAKVTSCGPMCTHAGRVQGAAHDEVVVAQAAQGVAPVAARVGVEHRARERRAAGDAVAAAGRGARARQGPGREDEQVLRAERLHVVQPLAQRQVHAQTAPAEEGSGRGGG